jgi:hypothetical protein
MRKPHPIGIAVLRFGHQKPKRVAAAAISAGIVTAKEYQKFHLTSNIGKPEWKRPEEVFHTQ